MLSISILILILCILPQKKTLWRYTDVVKKQEWYVVEGYMNRENKNNEV